MAPFADKPLDFTHTIKHLSFGPQYPGMVNPLDGASSKAFGPAQGKLAGSGSGGGRLAGGDKGTQSGGGEGGKTKTGMYQYFLKVSVCFKAPVNNRCMSPPLGR